MRASMRLTRGDDTAPARAMLDDITSDAVSASFRLSVVQLQALPSIARLPGSPAASQSSAASGENLGRGLCPEDVVDPAVEGRGVRARLDARAIGIGESDPGAEQRSNERITLTF